MSNSSKINDVCRCMCAFLELMCMNILCIQACATTRTLRSTATLPSNVFKTQCIQTLAGWMWLARVEVDMQYVRKPQSRKPKLCALSPGPSSDPELLQTQLVNRMHRGACPEDIGIVSSSRSPQPTNSQSHEMSSRTPSPKHPYASIPEP